MESTTLTLELPGSMSLTITLNSPLPAHLSHALQDDLRQATIIHLYRYGLIIESDATDMLGCSAEYFEQQLLPQYTFDEPEKSVAV